jgi:hypothetical protein
MDEHLENYLTILITYLFYTESQRLYKFIRKFINKLDFFNNTSNSFTKGNTKYLLASGKAEKLYTISGELYNNKIIDLTPQMQYHEDFILNPGRMFIQPYDKTDYILKPKIPGNNIFYKILAFFFPAQALENGDKIVVYGKVNNNKFDIMNEYSDYTLITAKEVFYEYDKTEALAVIQKQEINKITLQAIKVSFLASLVYLLTRYSIWPKMKRLLKLIKYKARIYCQNCGVKPCNLLCEKCEYLTSYCHECYIGFQDKINALEIVLENIKCGNCNSILDKAQKLLTENN